MTAAHLKVTSAINNISQRCTLVMASHPKIQIRAIITEWSECRQRCWEPAPTSTKALMACLQLECLFIPRALSFAIILINTISISSFYLNATLRKVIPISTVDRAIDVRSFTNGLMTDNLWKLSQVRMQATLTGPMTQSRISRLVKQAQEA